MTALDQLIESIHIVKSHWPASNQAGYNEGFCDILKYIAFCEHTELELVIEDLRKALKELQP